MAKKQQKPSATAETKPVKDAHRVKLLIKELKRTAKLVATGGSGGCILYHVGRPPECVTGISEQNCKAIKGVWQPNGCGPNA